MSGCAFDDSPSTSAQKIIAALVGRSWSVGVAESLTGGDLASALVGVPGASAVMRGGVVAYDSAIKHSLLGVDLPLLQRWGAVHPDVAAQMAEGVRKVLAIGGREAELGLSTTGIAGPDSPDGQPVGTVHIGIASPFGVRSETFRFTGDRSQVREAAVRAALKEALVELGIL